MVQKTSSRRSRGSSKDKSPWALDGSSKGKIPKALECPSPTLELIKLLDSPEVRFSKIIKVLELDPPLVGELLRVANSVAYSPRSEIYEVRQALGLLGTSTVKRLVLTLSMGAFTRSLFRDEKQEACWHHSVACAILARHLAAALGQPEERAYTAGLLHDIGRLALMAQYPDEYGELLTIARHGHFNQIECERELFDIDHCQAGGWLAGEWNFPEDLANSIALHHSAELKEGSLPFVVSAACRIADILGFGVLQTPLNISVEDHITALSLRNPRALGQQLQSCTSEIRAAIAVIKPAS